LPNLHSVPEFCTQVTDVVLGKGGILIDWLEGDPRKKKTLLPLIFLGAWLLFLFFNV